MPSWLAAGHLDRHRRQFVPTIGTYIAIVLPVLVGPAQPHPWIGCLALVWAVLYQQVENLTIEPRISARAVDVHPAVAFASVMLGAALFGVAGALLAIPVSAMLIALGEIYGRSGTRCGLTSTCHPYHCRPPHQQEDPHDRRDTRQDTTTIEGPAAR